MKSVQSGYIFFPECKMMIKKVLINNCKSYCEQDLIFKESSVIGKPNCTAVPEGG